MTAKGKGVGPKEENAFLKMTKAKQKLASDDSGSGGWCGGVWCGGWRYACGGGHLKRSIVT